MNWSIMGKLIKWIRDMDMVYSIKVVVDMRDNGEMISFMAKENSSITMVMFILANGKMEREMV